MLCVPSLSRLISDVPDVPGVADVPPFITYQKYIYYSCNGLRPLEGILMIYVASSISANPSLRISL